MAFQNNQMCEQNWTGFLKYNKTTLKISFDP